MSNILIGFLLLRGATAWTVDIASDITVNMNHILSVPFSIYNISSPKLLLSSTDNDIAIPSLPLLVQNGTFFNGIVNITGVFLGRTKLIFNLLLEDKVSNKYKK
jgi:hypothetical protein